MFITISYVKKIISAYTTAVLNFSLILIYP
jgi:hypothetical protein